MNRVACALLIGFVIFRATAAYAEEEKTSPEEQENEEAPTDVSKLEREFNDPLTTLPQIFVQDAYTPANYGTDAQTNRVIARAIIPRIPRFSLFPLIQLVRPTVTLVTVPEGRGSATRTELGDSQFFDFAVLPGSSKERGLLWGAGPVFVFPTATDKIAGQGSWQAGPGAGFVYKAIPGILLGGLIQNPISFAYTSPERKPTSTLLIQPIVVTHIGWGFYLKSADATWAINWYRHGSTTIPLSLGIGYVRVRDGMPPINLFVTGEWMAYRQFAPVAPQTTIRFGMTIAIPGWRWWD
jgi:hypothetical protein